MKTLIRLLRPLLLLLVLVPTLSIGQVINVDSNQVVTSDTVNYFDSASFSINLYKADSLPYIGVATVRLGRIIGSTFNILKDVNINVQFNAIGDSQSVFFRDFVEPSKYSFGSNNLAILVHINNVPSGDTLLFPMVVRDAAFLRINGTPTLYPDTISYGSIGTVTANIKNVGNLPTTPPITLVVGVIDSIAGTVTIIDSAQNTNALPANDSITITVNTTITAADFSLGGNGVVIWPIAPDADAVDSSAKNVIVVEATSIAEPWSNYESLILFPNPAKDQLFWQFNGTSFFAEHVRMVDVQGKLVFEQHQVQTIDLSSFSKGIYFLEVQLDEQRVKTFKVLKQ